MPALRLCCLLLGLMFLSVAGAKPLAEADVPEALKPWVPWVLHGHEERACPFLYSDGEARRCTWPGPLSLALESQGGSFAQQWSVVVPGWVPLPGDARHWPQDVTAEGEPIAVVERAGVPSVFLDAGSHALHGELRWERLPESLQVPRQTGLVSVSVSGEPVAFPDMDHSGRLWLAERDRAGGTKAGVTNTLDAAVFRRIVDDIPLQVISRIELKVAGEPREVLLGPALLADYIPLSLDSPVPARLEPDGRLRLQVRPGRWTVTLVARHPGPVQEIAAGRPEGPWPEEEVWVFEARNHLRLVTLEGLEPVDPRQTSLPVGWRELPAYRVSPADRLGLVEKRRGDPEPDPDRLSLRRNLWLDFDGGGYTVQDRISGTLTRGWRLEADPPLKLGRVVVDGAAQFITRLPGADREGVEVRRGRIDLVADSRLESSAERLPAAGWGHDFQSLGADLNLPPGWRLLAASGADRVQDTWLTRWSLLDLFVALIIAAVVGRLWGWPWGLLALATLALVYHEPGAPRLVWLNVLAAAALLRVLPTGRFRRLVGVYRGLALVALAVIALPFLVDQVRIGLYPVVERPWQPVGAAQPPGARAPQIEALPQETVLGDVMDSADMAENVVSGLARPAPSVRAKTAWGSGDAPQLRYDPKANIQTGPGLPSWTWRSVRLVWNGPVERGQDIRLFLVPPGINLVLRLFSVVLLALLALRVTDVRYRRGAGIRLGSGGVAMVVLGVALGATWPHGAMADMPPRDLLNELRGRLLEKPECLPQCAEVARMRLDVDADTLRARLEVDSLAEVAVPLPGGPEQWLPETVLLGGKPAQGLRRDEDGRLWLRLGAGRHQVLLEGPLGARDTVQLSLPLKPRRVEANVRGWTLEGLHEDGLVDAQFQLTREREQAPDGGLPALEASSLPSFARVERTLRLGLDWQVETRVVRVSPPGAAVVLEVPLLEGESVTTPGVRVAHGKALVNMAPSQGQYGWQSVLERKTDLRLTAPEVSGWTEVWRLDVGPVWHARIEGIAVVHHQSEARWLPEWRPWPGESVSIGISRPEGVQGKTLTVDKTSLQLKPGKRATDTGLTITLRSSQGGQHSLRLPEGAQLLLVAINGASQAIRQEGRRVTLPLTPGRQEVDLTWRLGEAMDSHFATPVVDLGLESVNATIRLQVPRNRWVLFAGGPRVGPAVLIWGVLVVIVLVAVALGRTRRIPLKTHHWLLLGLGLSQIPVWLAIVVVAWLFALSARRTVSEALGKWTFNLMQLGLAVLTLVALGLLFHAVEQGLLGRPDMQIAGNGSTGHLLSWYQDRAGTELPRAWVFSVPMFVYRALMLAWALWLAFALIRWLRWGWECYASGGLWRSVRLARPGSKKATGPSAGTPQAEA